MFVLAVLAPSPVYAATLAVPTQHATIQAAINAAQPGDTVEVAAGTYPQAIDLNGKDLILVGLGGSAATLITGAIPLKNAFESAALSIERCNALRTFSSAKAGTELGKWTR